MNRFFRRGRALSMALALAFATSSPLQAGEAPNSVLTIAIGGDLLGPYQSLAGIEDAGFEEIKRILVSADAGIANHEGSTFDADHYEFYPSAENNGLPLGPEIVAHELRAMGITLLSKANNHAVDWGLEGLQATEAALNRAGIAFAGSGDSDREARAAAYVDTRNGRVGLISMASTFQPMARAADASANERGALRARPGISVVRLTPSMRLPSGDFAEIVRIAGRHQEGDAPGSVLLGTQSFLEGEKPGFDYAIDERDETAILQAVRDAAQQSRAAIVAIHAHETDSGDSEDPTPPDFLTRLAHQSIDAGAAAFVRHGPHGVNGIEIYRGRPIFHGVGSLFFDFGGRRSYTVPETSQVIDFPDCWFEGFLAILSLSEGRPVAVRLYPLLLDDTNSERSGIPRLAHGDDATRILERVQDHSEPFGTHIAIENGIGTIFLDSN